MKPQIVSIMDVEIYIDKIKEAIAPHMGKLQNFEFSVTNPLFWTLLFVLFVILSGFWDIKKSFSFCLTIAIMLLVTTKAERFLAEMVFQAGGTFKPIFIRVISIVLCCFVVIYYVFIKPES